MTSATRLAGLSAIGMTAVAAILLVTPSMSRDGAALAGTALGCLVLLLNARLRLISLV